jgi:hypothetical protein
LSLWFAEDGRFLVDPDDTDETDERETLLSDVYPTAAPETRALRAESERHDRRAKREIAWFVRVMGGQVPELGVGSAYARPAAEKIDRWLRGLRPAYRDLLALAFESRVWPRELAQEFGALTSVVVRLESRSVADGTGRLPAEREVVAVRRLVEAIEAREPHRQEVQGTYNEVALTPGELALLRKTWRAKRLVQNAVTAYREVRDGVPNVLPHDVVVPEGDL